MLQRALSLKRSVYLMAVSWLPDTHPMLSSTAEVENLYPDSTAGLTVRRGMSCEGSVSFGSSCVRKRVNGACKAS